MIKQPSSETADLKKNKTDLESMLNGVPYIVAFLLGFLAAVIVTHDDKTDNGVPALNNEINYLSSVSDKTGIDESLIKDYGDKFGLGFHVLAVNDYKFYAFDNGSVIMQGTLVDKDGVPDLSSSLKDVRADILSNLVDSIPVIKTGTPDSPKVFVFTDPDCPYCRKLMKVEIPNVEIINILLPLDSLHPDARAHIQQIFNTGNPALAMRDIMVEGASLPDVYTKESNRYPFDKVIKDFGQMGLRGTPSLVAPDGSIVPLFMDRLELVSEMVSRHQ